MIRLKMKKPQPPVNGWGKLQVGDQPTLFLTFQGNHEPNHEVKFIFPKSGKLTNKWKRLQFALDHDNTVNRKIKAVMTLQVLTDVVITKGLFVQSKSLHILLIVL